MGPKSDDPCLYKKWRRGEDTERPTKEKMGDWKDSDGSDAAISQGSPGS